MLARQSTVRVKGGIELRTPLLVPSFSSKCLPEVAEVLQFMAAFITDPILVSAYDVHYGKIRPRSLSFPNCVILDSGGYEARIEHDLSEAYGRAHHPRGWSEPNHRSVLTHWPATVPTIAVTYDSPRVHQRFKKQLARAKEFAARARGLSVEFLVKPEAARTKLAPMEELTRNAKELHEFAAIGVTEKELDESVLGRLKKIAHLRLALDAAGLSTPIHVFGSLDPIGSVLYFLAGAEIFDGLTWLRFGYEGDRTLYSENYNLLQAKGIRRSRAELASSLWKSNYYYLQELREKLVRFVGERDFRILGPQAGLFEEAVGALTAEVGGG